MFTVQTLLDRLNVLGRNLETLLVELRQAEPTDYNPDPPRDLKAMRDAAYHLHEAASQIQKAKIDALSITAVTPASEKR